MGDTLVNWILIPLMHFAQWVIALFPTADLDTVTAALGPLGQMVGYIALLNETFPITEGLAFVGIVIVIYTALYGVMLVRRIFSLIWPGAGS